jgi:hypothetical protein
MPCVVDSDHTPARVRLINFITAISFFNYHSQPETHLAVIFEIMAMNSSELKTRHSSGLRSRTFSE